jgi:TonB family protein
MRRSLWIVPFVLLTASYAIGQDASPAATPPSADAQPAKVMVYTMEPGVTAPELLPSNQPPIPEEKCKKKVDGVVVFSAFVDATGVLCDVKLLHSVNSEVDEIARKVIAEDRFKPGSYKGVPVPVAGTLDVTLQTCLEEKKSTSASKIYEMRLMSLPEQKFASIRKSKIVDDDISDIRTIYKVGHGVSAPYPINQVNVEFSEPARKARYQGIVLVSLIVDEQGMPRNPRVVRALGMGLDEKAIEAVKKYRFKPAMKDGKPVAVPINIEINFRLYDRPGN